MDFLRSHVEQIVPLSDEEFDDIKNHFSAKRVRKHQFLLHEGDDVTHEFLVVSGFFKVYYLDTEGKQYILQFGQNNWWMCDYYAFFHRKPANMFIECMEDGEILSLSMEARETLTSENRKMEKFFRTKLTYGFAALQQRVKLLLSSNPQQRYDEFASIYPALIQKLPKKVIAEFLGVSRETLSRLHPASK